MTQGLAFLNDLSPTQEHFLKKFLVEACLRSELTYLSQPQCLEYLGPPFKTTPQKAAVDLPLLRFFFGKFVASFPFITMNKKTDQIAFWRDTVQPFVESFNNKRVLSSDQRKEQSTKRRQVNKQLLRTLLLFYNSMLSSKKELQYLSADHLKPSDQGKLDKISKSPAMVKVGLDAFHAPESIDDYAKMVYINNYNVNIVAVDVFHRKALDTHTLWLFNPLRLISSLKPDASNPSSYHCVFILQVTKRSFAADKQPGVNLTNLGGEKGDQNDTPAQNPSYVYQSHFISRTYSDFKALELALKSDYPGLMSTDVHAMPGKIKNDMGIDTKGASSMKSSKSIRSIKSGASHKTIGSRSASFASAITSKTKAKSGHRRSSLGSSKSPRRRGSINSTTSKASENITAKSGKMVSPKVSAANGPTINRRNSLASNSSSTLSATLSPQGSSPVSPGSGTSYDTAEIRGVSRKYCGEKLRLALRGYINSLLHKPEIANCAALLDFIDDPAKNFKTLSSAQFQDYNERMELEKMRLATQEEFQNHIARVVYQLTGNFEIFKTELLNDPHQLSAIFEEIGRSADPTKISPLLTSFIEWCKLEIAATLYQMFLTQDNSSQWLQKCRKFHRVFPYRMCYGILKYTNPMKMMSRMVDLLLMNVPTFGRKSNQANNLLSMIFIMLLDEDLQDFSKERQKLLSTAPLNRPEFKVFFTRVQSYVYSGEALLEGEIQQELIRKNGSNFFLSVLSSDLVEPKLSELERDTFNNVIMPSFQNYEGLNKGKTLDGATVYVSLKQFWQLEIRTRDKEIFKQLWREPELTQLIKKVLTVFYQPLMTVMKKCNVHLVFRDFQNFLDDLLAELTVLDEGELYFTSSVEMFNRFKKLLDKYEGTFYRFLHDLHNKDDGKLFMKLIAWIESFLVALRTKFKDPEMVQLDFANMAPSEPVDEKKFLADLNSRMELILKKRLLLKSCIRNAASAGAFESSADDTEGSGEDDGISPGRKGRVLSSHQRAIDQQWERLNNGLFEMEPQDLGVSGDDLEEFNLTQIGERAADAFRSGLANAQVLRQIAELDRLMNESGDLEIYKLMGSMREQIQMLIDGLEEGYE